MNLEAIHAECETFFSDLAERHGVVVMPVTLNVNDLGNYVAIKTSLSTKDRREFWEENYKAFASELGFDETWLGTSLFDHSAGKSLTLRGIDVFKNEFPIVLEAADGTIFLRDPISFVKLIKNNFVNQE